MPRRPTDLIIQQAVGARLATTRRGAAVTQEALAATLGIEPGTLSRYEQGRVPLTVPLLVLAAKALGVQPAQLLAGVAQDAPAGDEESEMLRLWHAMPPARRAALIGLLREMRD